MGKKEKIIEYIKEIYKPTAIVLAGSRASGNFSPTSDWDFYVFTDKEFEWGFDRFEDEVVDVSVQKYPIENSFIFDTKYHPEQFLEAVFDMSSGSIQEAIERTNKKYLEGPSSISENEYQRLKKVMMRYIQKAEGRKELRGLSFYYLGIFYEIALRLWFQLQNKWPLSPHESLNYIQKKDVEFFRLLENISTSLDVESAKNIHSFLFKR